jgi:hypothetical protein
MPQSKLPSDNPPPQSRASRHTRRPPLAEVELNVQNYNDRKKERRNIWLKENP